MKVKVLQEFWDKYNRDKKYEVGDVVDFEQTRAEDIVSRGLGEEVVPPAPRKPRAKK